MFGSEEVGLIGAKAYAKKYKDRLDSTLSVPSLILGQGEYGSLIRILLKKSYSWQKLCIKCLSLWE
jgi:hypothetical protein